MTESKQALDKAEKLPCWKGSVKPEPLSGGITNTNFVVSDRGERFVVRIGEDIPVHGVMRFNEQAASLAAFEAGVSPEVVYAERGALVLRFIEGQTLTPETVRQDESRMSGELEALMTTADNLEKEVGPRDLVYGHNDLLAANFIDDGDRLWLVDWDYAGYNSPLFDLGGLASNNELSPEQEQWMLKTYYGTEIGRNDFRRYEAMKCASLLREAMWSMVQEIHSALDFDFVDYTDKNLTLFQNALEQFKQNSENYG